MNFLYPRQVKHGETVESYGLWFMVAALLGEKRQGIMQALNVELDIASSKPMFELVRQFQDNDMQDWGHRPPAPEGNEDLVDSILQVWTQQGYFILFIDGNSLNWAINNLKQIDLAAALRT